MMSDRESVPYQVEDIVAYCEKRARAAPTIVGRQYWLRKAAKARRLVNAGECSVRTDM
jgi:hypothetical protein